MGAGMKLARAGMSQRRGPAKLMDARPRLTDRVV